MLLQQVIDRFALRQDLAAVALAGIGVVADQGEQLRLGDRTSRVVRHDLDLLAGRGLLQLDEIGEQAADRHRLAGRQLRAAALGDLEPDLVGGQKAEAARHRIDQRRIVARHHAEMIADPIADVGRQLHLDMPRRAIRRIGAGSALQLAIGR